MATSLLWFLRLSLYGLVILFGNQQIEARSPSYLENNEVTDKVYDRTFYLPTCKPDAICGYLQANARGINTQQLCACETGMRCPMNWDPQDGYSVTQGSDQYKFCTKVSSKAICEDDQVAYSSRMVYSKATEKLLEKSDRIHCICPADHNYIMAIQDFDQPDPDTEGLSFSHACARLPVCKIGDACKIISESGPDFMVNQKCRCPDDLRCPTVGNHAVKTLPYANGRVNMLRCQH